MKRDTIAFIAYVIFLAALVCTLAHAPSVAPIAPLRLPIVVPA